MASFIISGARTPVGRFLGGLSSLTAPQLGAVAVREAVARSGLEPPQVDEVLMGIVLQGGVGQAPARQAALQGGLPPETAAVTVNKVCGSGLKAVMLADQAIRCGDVSVAVAGGMESMSRAPHLLPHSRTGFRFGTQSLLDSMLHDGLWCATEQVAMGDLAERTARQYQVSRADQDAFAAESHRRAVQSAERGEFDREIVPVERVSRDGAARIGRDEGPRSGTSRESLAQLAPAFSPQGTVTAGNASQISDGAAAVVVVSEPMAVQARTAWKARIVAAAVSGVPPRDLFIAPVSAIRRVLDKAGMTLRDIDLIEINEAFAAQVLACLQALDLDAARVNVRGGAIALGHPIGASGARVLVTLIHSLLDRGQSRGLAALCLGGGNAVAMIVEIV
jgi:acetyl-CoA C-acetyltransferase